MPNFIDDPVTLAPVKSDKWPLGTRDPTKHIPAAHWNELRQALIDIRERILDLDGDFLTVEDGADFLTVEDGASIAGSPLFGDGNDGAVTWDGSSTILGMAPVANVYTLTRDVYAIGSTINSGVTIDAAGFRYFDNGTLTLNGKISRNGGNGGNASGASAGTAGAKTAGLSRLLTDGVVGIAGGGGGAGGASTAAPRGFTVGNCGSGGTVAAAQTGSTGPNGGIGQGGGGGGSGGHPSGSGPAGGVGGTVTHYSATTGGDVHDLRVAMVGVGLRSTVQITPGASGGGGTTGTFSGSGAGGGGGGSGAGGGYLVVCARKFAGTGTIEAKGGNGGNGGNATGTSGGGGGGGGGAGGIAVVIGGAAPLPTVSVAGGNVIPSTGGTGGTGAGNGGPGGAGGAGLAITYVCS